MRVKLTRRRGLSPVGVGDLRAGAPTTVAPGGTSSTTTALAPIRAPAPTVTGPDQLGAGADAGVLTDRRPGDVAGAQPDRHERRDHDPGVDLDQAVDDHLTVDDVHARMHHDRIADRDLRGHHRQPVGDPGQHRHAERLQPGLAAIQRLREERVADPGQAEDLRDRVQPGAERVALAAVPAPSPGRPP